MKRTVVAVVITAVAAMGLTACDGSEGPKSERTPTPIKVWPTRADGTWPTNLCPEEDSPGPCLWIASKQGNGLGRSFWVDADQNVHYFGDPKVN